MTSNEILQVNLESVIKKKAPKAHKRIPTFIIRLVEMIVRQKEMNRILAERKYAIEPNGTYASSLSEPNFLSQKKKKKKIYI